MTATHSMTGFGEASATNKLGEVKVEIKSVNHRFLDVVLRLPNSYNSFEHRLLPIVHQVLKRGRVEISVTRSDFESSAFEPVFNKELFQKNLEMLDSALKLAKFNEGDDMYSQVYAKMLASLLQRREIVEFVHKSGDIENEFSLVEETLKKALTDLVLMRKAEGAALEKELRSLLAEFEAVIKKIAKEAKGTPEQFKERLQVRIDKLAAGVNIEPERLAQELAFLADRIDITEELTRLDSHLKQFRQILKTGDGGRKLEFLLQEMSREVNTSGSKAQNSEVSACIVDAKALLEKLKEQVLNIE